MVEKSKDVVPVPASRDPPDRRGVAFILWRIVTATETRALAAPTAPPDLPELPPLLRIHASLRLFLLDVDYALSPGGQLRGLAKLICRVAIAAGLLTLLLASVLACVAVVLAVLVAITGQVVAILWNLLMAALLLVGLLAMGAGLLLMVRFLIHPR